MFVEPKFFKNNSGSLVGSSIQSGTKKQSKGTDTFRHVVRLNGSIAAYYKESVMKKTKLRVFDNHVFKISILSNTGFTKSTYNSLKD